MSCTQIQSYLTIHEYYENHQTMEWTWIFVQGPLDSTFFADLPTFLLVVVS